MLFLYFRYRKERITVSWNVTSCKFQEGSWIHYFPLKRAINFYQAIVPLTFEICRYYRSKEWKCTVPKRKPLFPLLAKLVCTSLLRRLKQRRRVLTLAWGCYWGSRAGRYRQEGPVTSRSGRKTLQLQQVSGMRRKCFTRARIRKYPQILLLIRVEQPLLLALYISLSSTSPCFKDRWHFLLDRIL